MREKFSGTFIVCGEYNLERAQATLAAGEADLIGFGRPFLANPTLVEKLKAKAPLTEMNYALNYTPGEEGYTTWA